MSQYRDVLATNTAVERVGFCRNIYGPNHEKTDQSHGPPSSLHPESPLGPQSSTVLTHVDLVAICVAEVTQTGKSTGLPLFYLLQPAQIII